MGDLGKINWIHMKPWIIFMLYCVVVEGQTPWITVGNQEYLVSNTLVTWLDAQRACDTLGGHLARFTDRGTANNVAAMLIPNLVFWIDLNDRQNEGAFLTSEGLPYPFVHWFTGEPNNLGTMVNETNADCVVYENVQGMRDRPCDNIHHYVCQRALTNNSPVPPSLVPGTSTMNPTMIPPMTPSQPQTTTTDKSGRPVKAPDMSLIIGLTVALGILLIFGIILTIVLFVRRKTKNGDDSGKKLSIKVESPVSQGNTTQGNPMNDVTGSNHTHTPNEETRNPTMSVNIDNNLKQSDRNIPPERPLSEESYKYDYVDEQLAYRSFDETPVYLGNVDQDQNPAYNSNANNQCQDGTHYDDVDHKPVIRDYKSDNDVLAEEPNNADYYNIADAVQYEGLYSETYPQCSTMYQYIDVSQNSADA